MRVVRYELRSAAELDTLARAPLPLGIHAAQPARLVAPRSLPRHARRRAARAGRRLPTADRRAAAAPAHAGSSAAKGRRSVSRRPCARRPPSARSPPTRRCAAVCRAWSIRRSWCRASSSRWTGSRAPRTPTCSSVGAPRCTSTASRSAATASRARSSSSARTIGAGRSRSSSGSSRRSSASTTSSAPRAIGAGSPSWCCAGCGPPPRAATHASSDHESPFVTTAGATPEMLSPELSLLAFQRRVLAIAEDPATPLRERLRFLGIVTSNLDEIFMVRMPELRQAAASRPNGGYSRGLDGLTAGRPARSRGAGDRVDRRRAVALRGRVSARRPRRSACASCAGANWRRSSRPASAPAAATRSIRSSRRSR